LTNTSIADAIFLTIDTTFVATTFYEHIILMVLRYVIPYPSHQTLRHWHFLDELLTRVSIGLSFVWGCSGQNHI
jgi:hypothetical protein